MVQVNLSNQVSEILTAEDMEQSGRLRRRRQRSRSSSSSDARPPWPFKVAGSMDRWCCRWPCLQVVVVVGDVGDAATPSSSTSPFRAAAVVVPPSLTRDLDRIARTNRRLRRHAVPRQYCSSYTIRVRAAYWTAHCPRRATWLTAYRFGRGLGMICARRCRASCRRAVTVTSALNNSRWKGVPLPPPIDTFTRLREHTLCDRE